LIADELIKSHAKIFEISGRMLSPCAVVTDISTYFLCISFLRLPLARGTSQGEIRERRDKPENIKLTYLKLVKLQFLFSIQRLSVYSFFYYSQHNIFLFQNHPYQAFSFFHSFIKVSTP
jgi:hypothetical protein